jgi:DNA-directed RNA polymerase subunit RPC12/RpoP
VSIPVKCNCGRSFRVSDTAAGKAARCPHCGARVLVPSRTVDAGYRMEPSDQDDDLGAVDWRKNLPRVERTPGHCQLCNQPADRKFSFYGGEIAGVGEVERRGNAYGFTTTYRNLRRHTLFLCDPCAAGAYRKTVLPRAILWACLVVLPVVSLIVCLVVLPRDARLAVLLGHFILLGVLLIPLMISLWRLGSPNYSSEAMDRIVVQIAQRDRPDLGPSFMTRQEYARRTEHS